MSTRTWTDASLREVVERILPLATHYTAVLAFTELQNNIEYGLVNHALCAAIRDILHVRPPADKLSL